MTVLFILLNVALIGGVAWWMRRTISPSIARVYWPALCAKLSAGIILGILYKYYFESGSDTFGFFNDAIRINEWALQSPAAYIKFLVGGPLGVELYNSEPRTLLFITLLSFVNFISGFNYWISSCWLSLFSFLCAWRLFEVLNTYLPKHRTAFAIALLFFPSITFWSAGVLKESLAWGSLCVLCAAFVEAMHRRLPRGWQWLLLPICLLLLVNLKYYWAAVAIACMATSLVVNYSFGRRVNTSWKLTLLWFVVFIVFVTVVSRTHPNFYLERFPQVIAENHNKILDSSEPENELTPYYFRESWLALTLGTPRAFVSGLFRPFIFEAHSIASGVYAIENLVLLLLFVGWLRRRHWSNTNHLFILASVVCVVMLCIFLSLSMPNFGTLSRYRIGFLPFFVILLLVDSPVVRHVERVFKVEVNS